MLALADGGPCLLASKDSMICQACTPDNFDIVVHLLRLKGWKRPHAG